MKAPNLDEFFRRAFLFCAITSFLFFAYHAALFFCLPEAKAMNYLGDLSESFMLWSKAFDNHGDTPRYAYMRLNAGYVGISVALLFLAIYLNRFKKHMPTILLVCLSIVILAMPRLLFHSYLVQPLGEIPSKRFAAVLQTLTWVGLLLPLILSFIVRVWKKRKATPLNEAII